MRDPRAREERLRRPLSARFPARGRSLRGAESERIGAPATAAATSSAWSLSAEAEVVTELRETVPERTDGVPPNGLPVVSVLSGPSQTSRCSRAGRRGPCQLLARNGRGEVSTPRIGAGGEPRSERAIFGADAFRRNEEVPRGRTTARERRPRP